MHARRAGVVAVAIVLTAAAAFADTVKRQSPTSPPPRLLNFVHVRVKPHQTEAYAALEAQIVRAYERSKIRLFWSCFQSTKDPHEILYLNTYDSREAADQAEAAYQDAIKKHPEIVPLQQRLTALTLSSSSMLTTRRDDIDRPPVGADLSAPVRMRVTTIQVKPGREGEFLSTLRTSAARDGSWLVYEANDASIYALVTPKKTALDRTDGPPVPRSVQQDKGNYTKAESRVYAARPQMSHVPQPPVRATTPATGGR